MQYRHYCRLLPLLNKCNARIRLLCHRCMVNLSASITDENIELFVGKYDRETVKYVSQAHLDSGGS